MKEKRIPELIKNWTKDLNIVNSWIESNNKVKRRIQREKNGMKELKTHFIVQTGLYYLINFGESSSIHEDSLKQQSIWQLNGIRDCMFRCYIQNDYHFSGLLTQKVGTRELRRREWWFEQISG